LRQTIVIAVSSLLLACLNAFAGNPAAGSKEWRAYVEPLAPVGERLTGLLSDPRDPQLRQEMYTHLYSVLAQGYFGLVHADAEYPAFWPFLNAAFNTLGPNPDDIYYLTPIQSDGVYRISGLRGTVRIISFDIGSGSFYTPGNGSHGPILGTHYADELHIEEDGSFEVVLSQKRPQGHTGDWWQLDSKGSYILVRQRAYDILHEVDGQLAIERLDRPSVKPRPNAAQLAVKLKHMAGWAEKNTKLGLDYFDGYRKRGFINKMLVHGYQGGLPTQKYADSLFDIKADEALILETEVPAQCRYWNFQLNDELYASLELMGVSLQAHLNGHTARLDADGKFRAVISSQDPGVPNWLDTGGYQRGEILGRWQECSSAPQPTLTKVKVADVRRYLPADTPSVPAEAREEKHRQMAKARQMRRKW